MFRRRLLSLATLVLVSLACLMTALPAAAATTAQDVKPRLAPAAYSLGQLKYSVQTLNNCGPAAVVATLSYYGVDLSQQAARKVLRPYSDYRGMSQTVIPPYVVQYGLQARVLVDGNAEIIKSLVANHIPVIVMQWVSETWHTGHFRVVQGYDDAAGVFYVDDSLLGPNLAISYASFDRRWGYNWARYVPVYRPDQAPLVKAILGPDATETGMFASRVPALQAQVKADPSNRMAWSHLVEALTGSEQYQAALDALDASAQHSSFGFGFSNFDNHGFSPSVNPTRLKLLNKLGRYDQALTGAEDGLSHAGSRNAGALWLQKAEALRGLGRTAEARAAYQQAIRADGILSEAGQRLATLA